MLAVDICSLENRRQSDSYFPIRNYAISPEVEPTICRHNVTWSRVFRRTSSHSSRCLGARFVGSARCWWSWNGARVSLKFSYYWMELCEDLEEISQWKLLKIVMVIKFHGDEEEWRMLSEAERRRVTPSKVEISRMKPNEAEWNSEQERTHSNWPLGLRFAFKRFYPLMWGYLAENFLKKSLEVGIVIYTARGGMLALLFWK